MVALGSADSGGGEGKALREIVGGEAVVAVGAAEVNVAGGVGGQLLIESPTLL